MISGGDREIHLTHFRNGWRTGCRPAELLHKQAGRNDCDNCDKKNMDSVEQYLNTIKKVMNRQVLIEAKIIDVELTERLQIWNRLEPLSAHILGSTVDLLLRD